MVLSLIFGGVIYCIPYLKTSGAFPYSFLVALFALELVSSVSFYYFLTLFDFSNFILLMSCMTQRLQALQSAIIL